MRGLWVSSAADYHIGHLVLQPHTLGPVSEVVVDPCSQLVTGPRSPQRHPEQRGVDWVESTGEVNKDNPHSASNVNV